MMKNGIIFLVVSVVTALSCSHNEKPTSTKVLIESQTKKYKYVDGKLDSTGILYEKIFFDQHGRDSIIENYNDSGLLFLRTVLYFDSAGNKVKSVDYNSDGNLESTTEYKYSDKGKIIESFRQHTGGGFNRGQFVYDSLGNRIKEIWTSKWYIDDQDEWYTSEIILLRTYNDKGFCNGVKESADGKPFKDKKTVFDSLGHIIYEDWGTNFRKFRYDKNGNQIEELSLDINNKLVNRWVSIYDINNVRIEYYTYNELNEPAELLKKEFIYK
jgi:hypothetical protein